MSFYHENVTWQNAEGKWRCGFFERISHAPWGDGDDDYDAEWDDEFGSDFEWVSSEHATADLACSSAPYPNPGHTNIYEYDVRNQRAIEDLERRFEKYKTKGVRQ